MPRESAAPGFYPARFGGNAEGHPENSYRYSPLTPFWKDGVGHARIVDFGVVAGLLSGRGEQPCGQRLVPFESQGGNVAHDAREAIFPGVARDWHSVEAGGSPATFSRCRIRNCSGEREYSLTGVIMIKSAAI